MAHTQRRNLFMGTTGSFRFPAPIKRGGREGFILYNGEKVRAKVSGRRTKITINGKKAKRKAVKPGINCTFNYAAITPARAKRPTILPRILPGFLILRADREGAGCGDHGARVFPGIPKCGIVKEK